MIYTCHSGGCPGSDMEWETQGEKYGVKTIAYSFYNHVQKGKNPKILTGAELDEGFEHVKIASKGLKRHINISYPYVKHLLCRNWFQVKNAESIFAIAKSMTDKIVEGGTGWAVQMAIDNRKPVFVFDQKYFVWKVFDYGRNEFRQMYITPTLTKNFAGIGTREINESGKNAIRVIYSYNLDADSNKTKNSPILNKKRI